MQAWKLTGYDGVEGLELGVMRIPPILHPNDVLVKVQATSVNPIDTALIGMLSSEKNFFFNSQHDGT